jgi:hypothetical protein
MSSVAIDESVISYSVVAVEVTICQLLNVEMPQPIPPQTPEEK